MYGYYGLTAVYPLHAFTWKKRITQLQMAQFLFAVGYGTVGYLRHGFCVYSILYPLAMFCLFSNFYYHAFLKTRPVTSRKAEREIDSFQDEQMKQDWIAVFAVQFCMTDYMCNYSCHVYTVCSVHLLVCGVYSYNWNYYRGYMDVAAWVAYPMNDTV